MKKVRAKHCVDAAFLCEPEPVYRYHIEYGPERMMFAQRKGRVAMRGVAERKGRRRPLAIHPAKQ